MVGYHILPTYLVVDISIAVVILPSIAGAPILSLMRGLVDEFLARTDVTNVGLGSWFLFPWKGNKGDQGSKMLDE